MAGQLVEEQAQVLLPDAPDGDGRTPPVHRTGDGGLQRRAGGCDFHQGGRGRGECRIVGHPGFYELALVHQSGGVEFVDVLG